MGIFPMMLFRSGLRHTLRGRFLLILTAFKKNTIIVTELYDANGVREYA